MTPEAVNLSPSERLALIPPPRSTISGSISSNGNSESNSKTGSIIDMPHIDIKKYRVGEKLNSNHQPGSDKVAYLPYTVEQELEICRRYLQDFICFDYGIPSSCVKYAKEVY
jgi:hypothetical protein